MLVFKKFDFYLLLPVIFLFGLGVAIISSVSMANLHNLLLFVVVSVVFFLIFAFLDIKIIFPFAPFFYLLSIFFLITPFIFGNEIRGSIRWISLGNFTIQPSELAKPFVALFVAWFWSNKNFSFKNLILFGLLLSPALGLIFFQPDLGSTLVILSMVIGVVLFSGIKRQQLLAIILFFVLITPLLYFSLKDYQKLRIVHFINPYSDSLGEGYNVIQSIIAVGSGGFIGKGLGKGTQSHLEFLPERHTDFIFASLAEELGFLGAIFTIILYLFLLFKILKIAKDQKEKQNFLLIVTLFFGLFFQTVVNIGMNVGLLPITGITLPLISYGGSSLLATMITLGIIENISRNSKKGEVIEIK